MQRSYLQRPAVCRTLVGGRRHEPEGRRILERSTWTLPALLIAVAMILVHPVHAQPQREISFEEALRIALNQNVLLQQSANEVALSSRQVFQQRMDFLPSLSFRTDGNRGSGFAQDQAGRNIAYSTTNVNGTFSSGINLFNGFADVAALEQAKHNREATAYVYDRTRQDVVFNTIDNFLLYVNAQEQVRIQEENLEAQRAQLDQIREFVNVGSRPISDQFQQEAQTAQAELEVLNAQRTAQLNKTRLIQVLQLEPLGNYEFIAPEVDELELVSATFELDNLLEEAFDRRLDIKAQEERILAAREGIRISRSTYYPRIDFGGNYRSNFTPDGDGGIFDQLDVNRGNSMGFSVSLPIFDRFTRSTRVQEAEVYHENALLDLRNTRQQVALQVRQAYLDYLMNQKRLDVTQTQERAARQALDAAQERYNVGAGTLVELTNARAGYVQAESNRIQARYDFLFQGKLVEYYVGKLDSRQPLLK